MSVSYNSAESVVGELRQEIGRGRSGVVFRDANADGDALACKVFNSHGLTKVVQWLFIGAPNPYMWNSNAAECAKIRRNILKLLVPIWTSNELRVADAESVIWNREQRAFELQTQFVVGRQATLKHSLKEDKKDEAVILWREKLPKLRSCLQQAGFNGLLWQAGIGNPVALNNFLRESSCKNEKGEISGPKYRWVWIDLESGVPAIFPISPKVLFKYSLLNWWRIGRPLFDDVDVAKLHDYLKSNADELRLALGTRDYTYVNQLAARLGQHQEKWKSVSRLHASIQYRLARGDIDASQANYFVDHRLHWVFEEVRRGLRSSARTFVRFLKSTWVRLRNFKLHYVISKSWRFLVSQKYRKDLIHNGLAKSIDSWTERGQMSAYHAQMLQSQIGSSDSSVYVTDFGIHIAIKPAVKIFQYWVLPALYAMGLLGGQTVAILILTGGPLARSVYTLGRLVQSVIHRYERPWIALGIGLLPVVGNLAYPGQMLYSIRGKDENLARFMLDDGFARLGRHFPVWGGKDTWTEHLLVRIPGKISRILANQRHGLADSATV